MATVKWLGEDETPDLKETTRFGVNFKKDESVEVNDEKVLSKLAQNKNFKVEGYEVPPDGPPPGVGPPWAPINEAPDGTKIYTAPSEQTAQYPVPKPGEPILEQEPPVSETKPTSESTGHSTGHGSLITEEPVHHSPDRPRPHIAPVPPKRKK